MKHTWYGPQMVKHLRTAWAPQWEQGALFYEQMLRREVSVPGPPRSLPGNPPHIDTSDLIESFEHVFDPSTFEAEIGNTSDHVVALEKGTKGRGGGVGAMAPRPFFLPALARWQNKIARIICKRL